MQYKKKKKKKYKKVQSNLLGAELVDSPNIMQCNQMYIFKSPNVM